MCRYASETPHCSVTWSHTACSVSCRGQGCDGCTWAGTVTLQLLFALGCEYLPALRMLAGRHEAVPAASGASPWRVHTLGVSVCKCRSCCRREFQALFFAAVCAAAKRDRMCFCPSLSLSPWWGERENFLISKSDLHDSSLCNAFYSSYSFFYTPS